MKQRTQLLGAFLLLALIVGAFFLPISTAQAAPATTYHRVLPKVSLLNEVSATIVTLSFRTHQRGVLSLRTLQQADLGIAGPGRYVGGFADLTIAVILDGSTIYTETKYPPSYTNPQVINGTYSNSIGIFTTHYLTMGSHTLTLNYTSHYSGLGMKCYDVGSPCGVHPTAGKAVLVIP